ncbi:hypothetical protein Q4Q35_03770 [Flavivirga aquimarina]|uniref:Uncharacterized protein n=1 Tax=Flavivirga aquimarina TaxID=2027862 RepID=A0ABT8W724_9FLAO|nr:hypothetical protein [Flavivirga aquimarina]MDO5968915.1 hypothetical protein [Flavivirga aquimarina]
MVKIYTLKEDTNVNRIILNYSELTYLRLYIHNFNDTVIKDFLDIDTKKIYLIRHNLHVKFGSKNWIKIISKAFEKGLIKREDFIESTVKRLSIEKTQIIFDKHICLESLTTNELKSYLLEFYRSCENEIMKEKFHKMKLDLMSEEIDFIKYKYQSLMVPLSISGKLPNFKFFKKINQSIFYKLDVSNWFNAFRVAFQLNILEKRDYWLIDLDTEINKTAEKLNAINKLNTDYYEKKNKVYYLLNKLYTDIEYSYLLNKNVFPKNMLT